MATISVVNNDVPTDPVALAALRREQAEAKVASAERAVAKAETHLEGAKLALAQATAELKGLD